MLGRCILHFIEQPDFSITSRLLLSHEMRSSPETSSFSGMIQEISDTLPSSSEYSENPHWASSMPLVLRQGSGRRPFEKWIWMEKNIRLLGQSSWYKFCLFFCFFYTKKDYFPDMKYIISWIISVLLGAPVWFFISMYTARYFVFLENYWIEILWREFPSEWFILSWVCLTIVIVYLFIFKNFFHY